MFLPKYGQYSLLYCICMVYRDCESICLTVCLISRSITGTHMQTRSCLLIYTLTLACRSSHRQTERQTDTRAHTCTHKHISYTHAHTETHTSSTTHTHIHTRARACAHTHTHTHARTKTHCSVCTRAMWHYIVLAAQVMTLLGGWATF